MNVVAVPNAAKISTTIGAICDEFEGEVQTGPFGSQLHASDYSDDGIPVVMPQDMIEGKISCNNIARVSPAHTHRLSQHQLRTGDIVFSRRGDVSRFAVVTPLEEGWLCGTGSIRIRLNCPDIDTGYLRHFLKQDTIGSWLLHHAKGVTMPNLNTAIIRAIPFVYPPLDEQRRIAAILDKADALRRKRKRAFDLLDNLTESIFLEMFGDPESNLSGWTVHPFNEVVDIDAPLVDPKKPEYMSLRHYGPDRIERDTGRLLPALTAEQDGLISSKFLCNHSHILYSKIRPYLNKVALSEGVCLCSADVYPISTQPGSRRGVGRN